MYTLYTWIWFNKNPKAETHFKKSKTSRGFNLDQKVSIFVKVFAFYFVAQFLDAPSQALLTSLGITSINLIHREKRPRERKGM
jgi:hypothetical protein